jgi:hypothetical protein
MEQRAGAAPGITKAIVERSLSHTSLGKALSDGIGFM